MRCLSRRRRWRTRGRAGGARGGVGAGDPPGPNEQVGPFPHCRVRETARRSAAMRRRRVLFALAAAPLATALLAARARPAAAATINVAPGDSYTKIEAAGPGDEV